MKFILATLLVVLSGCASHAGRPDTPPATDIASERRDADRAYAQGDIVHAARLYQSLTRAVPDDADLWFRLGNARFRLQQMDDAVTCYEQAVRLRPDHARALYNLGVVRLKQAQAVMLASAQAGPPGDVMRRGSERIAQRLAKVADDVPPGPKGEGGAPPFIIDAD